MINDRTIADASQAIKGLDELDRKVGKKYVRQALRAACKLPLGVARATAPVFSGRLQRSIKIRSAGIRRGVIKMNVGISKKDYTGDTFYGAFVAFGHRVGDRRLGDSRRLLAPNDWMDKAYDQTKDEAIEVFGETIADLIEGGQ